MKYNEMTRLRISAQSALLGRITSNVRGVYIKLIKNEISICVVIDGEENSYWNEVIYEIGTEIIADFNEQYDIKEELIRLDYPAQLSCTDYICIYQRYEN